MKKLSGFLAILALVLVFGFTFVSCGGGSAPKTIDGLFDELKGYTEVSMYAYADGFDLPIVWCGYHQKWEPYQSGVGRVHGGTPTFDFSAARYMTGSGGSSYLYDLYSNEVRNIVNTLNSFFDDGKKTGATSEMTWTNVPSSGIIWYGYYFYRDGRAAYGGSATPQTAPFMRDLYQF